MKRLVSLFSLAVLLAFPTLALATVVKKLDFDTLTLTSDQIVRAVVLSETSTEEPGSKKIFTVYRLKVVERLKGEPEEISLRLLGGVSNNIALRIPGMHYPKVGDEGVFFLKRYGQHFQPRGMGQGHFTLTKDVQNVERVTRDLHGVSVFDPAATGKAKFAEGDRLDMTYAELAQKVRAVLTQGK